MKLFISKEVLTVFMIMMLCNVHIINANNASMFAESNRITNKNKNSRNKMKSGSQAKITTENSTQKRFAFLLIIPLIFIIMEVTSGVMGLILNHKQREVLKDVNEQQAQLFAINLDACANSTLSSRRLRRIAIVNFNQFTIVSAPLKTELSNPTPAASGNNEPKTIANSDICTENAEKTTLCKQFITSTTHIFSDFASTIDEHEKEANQICSYITTDADETLDKIGESLFNALKTNRLSGVAGTLTNIGNIFNDVGMILTGYDVTGGLEFLKQMTGNESADEKSLSEKLFTDFTGMGLSKFGLAIKINDKVEVSRDANLIGPKGKTDKFVDYLSKFLFLIQVIMKIFSRFMGQQMIGWVGLVTSTLNIIKQVKMFHFKYDDIPSDEKTYEWIQFFEAVVPLTRLIIINIPKAFGIKDARIFGIIALTLDGIISIIKILSRAYGFIKLNKQKQEIEGINYEKMLNEKETEYCTQEINYIDEIMKLQSESAPESSASVVNADDKIKLVKNCKMSPNTCLYLDYNNKINNSESSRIYSEDLYKDLLYSSSIGPIDDIVISNNYETDEELQNFGYKIARRSFTNMNNLLYCKGCYNKKIVTNICLRKRDNKDMKNCYPKKYAEGKDPLENIWNKKKIK